MADAVDAQGIGLARVHLEAGAFVRWERLDGEKGFVLTPSIDHLFDKGFISFENNGELIVSPVANRSALARMGISMDQRPNVGAFSAGQKQFLDFHREHVLRMSNVRR